MNPVHFPDGFHDFPGSDSFNFVLNRNGIFSNTSSSVSSVLGYSADEFERLSADEEIFGNDKTVIMEHLHSCLKSKRNENFNVEALGLNGNNRILEVKLFVERAQPVNPETVKGIAHDITEKKIISDALYLVAQKGWKEKGETYFQSLVKYIGETFSLDYVLIDRLLSGHRAYTVGLYANGEVQPEMEYDLKGTPCENVLNCSLCVYKSKVQELFPEDVLLVDMGVESYLGIPLWDSSGKEIGIIAIMNGKPLGDTSLIETVLQIVAVRTAHEMERLRDEIALKMREEHLRITLNSIGDGVITIDEEGKILELNPVGVNLTGWNREDAIGSDLDKVLKIMPDEDGTFPPTGKLISDIIRTGQIFNPDSNLLLNKPKVGNIHVSTLWSPLTGHDGVVTGVVITLRDMSKEIRLRSQLIQSQKMDAIGQLAGGIAHDFNNMLAGILNSVQLLKSPKRSIDIKSMQYIDLIQKAARRAADLTSKLLAFGRKGNMVFSNVDLHSVIEEVHAILNRTLDKRIEISIELNAANHIVYGDNSELVNALLNLCINAGQAMNDGGNLSISTEDLMLDAAYCNNSHFDITAGWFCQVSIRDTGCGIPPENLNKIFDPFFTTKEIGKGTGLGLSTAYGSIQDHHGAIDIYSEMGEGTIVNVLLPGVDQHIELSQTAETLIQGQGIILVVDDEEFIRLTVSDMLDELGYDVLAAEDGEKAIEIFKENHLKIDLVILDMIMPKMNGDETYERMRTIDSDCKVIISSGFTKEEQMEKLREVGVSAFVKKPFDAFELSSVLRDILQKS